MLSLFVGSLCGATMFGCCVEMLGLLEVCAQQCWAKKMGPVISLQFRKLLVPVIFGQSHAMF